MLAILVAHDGAAWLGDAMDALGSQTHPQLSVVAVDNASTDGSRQLLVDRLGDAEVIAHDEDVGFARAVSAALETAAAREAEWIWLLHDDLVVEPDALEALLDHAVAHPRTAIVGPKLVDLEQPELLQQVGMTIDLTGRVDSGLEPDERDVGRHEDPEPVLYVSSAGLLVRRDVLVELGGLDERYSLFREDLDLCWRAWLAGHEVEVVPRAAGRHLRRTTNGLAVGRAASHGPRYLGERHALATLLKCYSARRLALVLPVVVLVGLARLVVQIASRRFGDAGASLRAWGWNLRELPRTWRRRRQVQATRQRTDGELRGLFGSLGTRVRANLEALTAPAPEAAQVSGEMPGARGSSRSPTSPRTTRALLTIGAVALVGLVAVAAPLIGPGPLRGGDFAPWPQSPVEFLRAYLAPWSSSGGLGGAEPGSPAQLLLGVHGVLTFGSAWLAPRVLVIGALPAAWLAAYASAATLTSRRGPRAVGATVYVLAPPVMAAVLTGRLGGMVAAVLLPVLAAVLSRVVRLDLPRAASWRAASASALLAAALVAFEPPYALLVVLIGLLLVGSALAVPAPGAVRRDVALRGLLVPVATFALLLPWSLELVAGRGGVIGGFGPPDAAVTSLARTLAFSPDLAGFPALLVGVAFPAAGIVGLGLAVRRRGWSVGAPMIVALLASFGAWMLGRGGDEALAWPGHLLLIAAGAYAVLITVGLLDARGALSAHGFGWRHVATTLGLGVVAAGMVGGVVAAIGHGWGGYTVDRQALPSFIGLEEETPFAYRVLVLVDDGGRVRWDVTSSEGASMLDYGTAHATDLSTTVRESVRDVLGRVSPRVADRLGQGSIRYVYVPEGGRTPELEAALTDQLTLEPQPIETGLVYAVDSWMPRAAFVPASEDPEELDVRAATDDPVEPAALDRTGAGRWQGRVPGRGLVALAEPSGGRWFAELDGGSLEARPDDSGMTRFVVPEAGEVVVAHAGATGRALAVALQALVLLGVISLTVRPLAFTQAETHR